MNRTNISRRGAQVIEEMERRDVVVFSSRDVSRFLGLSRGNTHRILTSMEEKGLIVRVERGKYILKTTLDKLDILEVVSHLFSPSYIGFWSALHFHGMTDQIPRKVFVVTTKRKRGTTLMGQEIVYVTVKKEMFFGYEAYGRVIASDREKTIIDCLRQPENAGGMLQISEAITEELDVQRLVEYCLMTGSSAVASRLGFILDKKGLIEVVGELQDMITTYSKLDPLGEKTNLNGKWKIYVNRGI